MNIKFYQLFGLAVMATLLFVPHAHGYAEPGDDRDCYVCHLPHNNDRYKLLNREAVNRGEVACFTCHSPASPVEAPKTQEEFLAGASHHPLSDDSECLICHDLNTRHMNGALDRWPDLALKDPDPEDSHVYSGARMNDFCLSCHDNSPISLGSPARTPVDLSSAYEFSGHGRIDINEPCNACHEHHASLNKPFMIKDIINDEIVTGNDNSVCYACHVDSDGLYLGKTVYQASEHGMQNKLCIDCHNPHGDNKDLCYLCHNEQYSSHYSSKRNKLCIDCHDPHQKGNLKMTREEEEKLCYQCHQDLEHNFGNLRKGVTGSFSHHKVDDEEFRGGNVECFDCHNPHAVTKFNVVSTQHVYAASFPKDAYHQKTDMYDEFCLGCHDGSRFIAKNIKAELESESSRESDFRSPEDSRNLHQVHKVQGYGCQNCHQAHSSSGTNGIKRGLLLHEDISVNSWDPSRYYDQGKSSCSASSRGMGCH